MKKRIILCAFLFTFLIVAASGISSYVLSYHGELARIDRSMENYISLVSDTLADDTVDNEASLKYIANQLQIRVTIIRQDGTVLYDTFDSEGMENHLSRPEVQEALKAGVGISQRFSTTEQTTYRYVAKREGDYVIRAAVENKQLKEIKWVVFEYIGFAAFLSLIFALLMAYLMTYFLVRPLNYLQKYIKGEKAQLLMSKAPKDIRKVADTFDEIKQQLDFYINDLDQKNLYLKNTINSMQDGFIALDTQRNITLINKRAKKIFDVEKLMVVGENLLGMTKDLELYEKTSQQQINVYEKVIGEQIFRITISPMINEKDNCCGSIILLSDITNMKKLENLRTEFVSNVTHELKTPLTSIIGFVDTLKNGAINDKKVAMKFLDIIDIESKRLNSLISDILVLSEIESKKKEAEEKEVNLREVAEEVLSLLGGKIEEKQLKVRFEAAKEVNYCCNADRLKQLFINLIDNGIKYNKQGGCLDISLSSGEDSVVFEIADTGIGIPREDLERVFERFYKVDKSRAKDNKSTGLGLSIVKHIVELYGGTISLESEWNQGTKITVNLPLKRGEDI